MCKVYGYTAMFLCHFFSKGDNFSDFLFDFLHDKAFLNGVTGVKC